MGAGRGWWALIALAVGLACGPGRGDVTTVGDLMVSNAYMAEALTADAVAVYFTVINTGDAPDTLTALSAAFAAGGAVHEQRARGGMVRMEPAGTVAIPAGGTVTLSPGGLHGMLVDLSRRPVADERVEVTIHFARAGTVQVPFDVVSYDALDERAGSRR